MYKFIDLFAGAGGFSEGFLQAECNEKCFDFVLASDINKTCEVTHRMRYNHQIGLNIGFLTKDIMDPDFIEALNQEITKVSESVTIDVITGGPPCQSFSLAGERKKNDKKDDLFSYYLKVIAALRPKYFVMENVTGILTKDGGKIKDRIFSDIKNIVDYKNLLIFIEKVKQIKNSLVLPDKNNHEFSVCLEKLFIALKQHEYTLKRSEDFLTLFNLIQNENLPEEIKLFAQKSFVEYKNLIKVPELEDFITRTHDNFVDAFRNNKIISEDERNIVRQAINLAKDKFNIEYIHRLVKHEMSDSHLNKSDFKDAFDGMLDNLSIEFIASVFNSAINNIKQKLKNEDEIEKVNQVSLAFEVITESVMDTVKRLISIINSLPPSNVTEEIMQISKNIHLYNIEKEIVLNASDFGVPQNRERVIFIGCRNDQKLITSIPPTIYDSIKVTVREALEDIKNIGIGCSLTEYPEEAKQFLKKYKEKLPKRVLTGNTETNDELSDFHNKKMTYIEWSRHGRLNPKRFPKFKRYYTSSNCWDSACTKNSIEVNLPNHETSNHNDTVQERYRLIRDYGDFNAAKNAEPNNKILNNTDKRNYVLLDPDSQSPTILTIGDDFTHYDANRCLTVREMARLQSFDDSFVFQGKRTTGGDRRKFETPQFTQVGNAVPPLLAHGIALEILKNIK